jgi:Ca2+-binding RTX toxin-like protein
MTWIVVQNPDFSFGNLSISGTNLQVQGRSPEVIVAHVGDDYFDFWGNGFTYDQGKIDLFGTTIDFGIDVVTGGTVTGFTFRDNGIPSFTVDGFSRPATSLSSFASLAGQNGPLLFSALLDGDDRIFLGNGNDTIAAGNGNDAVSGGGGNDQLRGDGGFDVLSGDAGNDTLTGGFTH